MAGAGKIANPVHPVTLGFQAHIFCHENFHDMGAQPVAVMTPEKKTVVRPNEVQGHNIVMADIRMVSDIQRASLRYHRAHSVCVADNQINSADASIRKLK